MGFLYQNWQRWKILTKMNVTTEIMLLFIIIILTLVAFMFKAISLGDTLIVTMLFMGFSLLIQKIVDVKNSED